MRNRARAILLAALSMITPAGLVAVNLAAYVMTNLAAFRLAITISAVVSTVVLNGLTGWVAYRLGAERWPTRWVFEPRNRRGVGVVAMVLLVAVAALAGFLTFRGLSDPRRLPNLQTFLAGLVGLAIPLLMLVLFREEANPRLRRRYRTR